MGINHKGDVFYSDNQGLWNGTSCVKHLKVGSFQGNPTGNKYYALTDVIGPQMLQPKEKSRIVTEAARIKEFVPPAANLPHRKLGSSTSGIALDNTNGKFGPFHNQLLANDQRGSQLSPVSLLKKSTVFIKACPYVSSKDLDPVMYPQSWPRMDLSLSVELIVVGPVMVKSQVLSNALTGLVKLPSKFTACRSPKPAST